VRGGLIVGSGIVLGNLIGFVRVAVTAYLLGTKSYADVLAVALGPLDTFNGALINTMIFAFVPMLTLQPERERVAFFLAARRLFMWIFGGMTVSTALFAPWLIGILGPGLSADSAREALRDLKARGMGDPILVASDGAPGLIRAIEDVLPRALRRKRCFERTFLFAM